MRKSRMNPERLNARLKRYEKKPNNTTNKTISIALQYNKRLNNKLYKWVSRARVRTRGGAVIYVYIYLVDSGCSCNFPDTQNYFHQAVDVSRRHRQAENAEAWPLCRRRRRRFKRYKLTRSRNTRNRTHNFIAFHHVIKLSRRVCDR